MYQSKPHYFQVDYTTGDEHGLKKKKEISGGREPIKVHWMVASCKHNLFMQITTDACESKSLSQVRGLWK